MKYDCYKRGASGAFEIDLNDPYETEEESNNVSIDDVIARSRAHARYERNNQKLNNTLGKASPYYSQNCAKLAAENDQLADWLEELKAYRANAKETKYRPICLGKGYNCGVCHAWIGYYDDSNYCWNCGKKIDWEKVKKMRKPTIKDRIWGVLMYIPEYVKAVMRNDKGTMELLKIIIKLTAKGDFEIDEDIHEE